MSTFYRQRSGWKFAPAARGEGVYVWEDRASGGQAAGAGDLMRLGPLGTTREQVDQAVDILGDAIGTATRSAP